MIVMDAISRHLPGTLGNQQSVIDESYLDGTLDYPHYTRLKTGDAQRDRRANERRPQSDETIPSVTGSAANNGAPSGLVDRPTV